MSEVSPSNTIVNDYSTLFRTYDARTGRWTSHDPILQPWESTYSGLAGNPAMLTDWFGLDADDGEGPRTMDASAQTTTTTTTETASTTTETSGGGQSVMPMIPMIELPPIDGIRLVEVPPIEVAVDALPSFQPIAPNAYQGGGVPMGSDEGETLAEALVTQRGVIGSNPPWICEGIVFSPQINEDGQSVFYLAIPERYQDMPGAESIIMSPEAVKNMWKSWIMARIKAFHIVNIYNQDGTIRDDSKALMLDDYPGAVKASWKLNLQDPNFYLGLIGAAGGGLATSGSNGIGVGGGVRRVGASSITEARRNLPVGRSGNPMKVEPAAGASAQNIPTSINGRMYSGHSLDRMQGRGIVPTVVDEVISSGVPYSTRSGTLGYYHARNNLRVIVNQENGRVITVIPGAP